MHLLSIPPNVVDCFHDITGLSPADYFVTADPADRKLGSGGGTAWLLEAARAAEAPEAALTDWLAQSKRVLLHAGGQSRRLPAYAPSGKVLTPVPVFRWARGQRIDQTLLDLQMPLYERILEQAPERLHTLIASGDVYIRTTQPLGEIPDADIVCYGLWADAEQASHHGVFMMNRARPGVLDFMLQKPSAEEQAKFAQTHLLLMDIGVWLLSDRAVEALVGKSAARYTGNPSDVCPFGTYDLYSEFGCALGENPSRPDADLARLSVAIIPLQGGEFYHFGTAADMLASTLAIQERIKDQRMILGNGLKRQAGLFLQNAAVGARPEQGQRSLWIENACVPATWRYGSRCIITGVPENDWEVTLRDGICLDIAPVGDKNFVLRPYGFRDAFRGNVSDASTLFLERPVGEWLTARGIAPAELGRTDDLQAARLFPVSASKAELEHLLAWFLADAEDFASDSPQAQALADVTALWRSLPRLSADEISARANLRRLFQQRKAFQKKSLPTLANNWQRSVFYQTNLKHMAKRFAEEQVPLPAPLPADAALMTRIHDAMFRSEVLRSKKCAKEALEEETRAFSLLREGMTAGMLGKRCSPHLSACADQIVWARSAARIDLAGGWTDTPPYSLIAGGNVVNVAIEMNGQQPLQVYVKPSKEPVIVCRSIDLGAMEEIRTFDELADFARVGSPFSIPKAALALAGFLPQFCEERFPSLEAQLRAFGSGLEITLFSAIPAGSGLGTSSILAATVLGALSDFCALCWDKNEIAVRTLVLEQLLTTGGGWQDQYGGVFPGVKLLQTSAGFSQSATVRWLPDALFTDPLLAPCHLLYYTGMTRTAKNILAEIVRGMFLNNTRHLALLDDMKQHALALYEAVQRSDIEAYGRMLRHTWAQNKALDAGTNPPLIDALCQRVDDLCLGYKLPGAGGGGFMYMVAKDAEAASRIRRLLADAPLAPNARFVDMTVSRTGLQISRS